MEVLGKVYSYKPLYANECESVFGVELSPIEHRTLSNVDVDDVDDDSDNDRDYDDGVDGVMVMFIKLILPG